MDSEEPAFEVRAFGSKTPGGPEELIELTDPIMDQIKITVVDEYGEEIDTEKRRQDELNPQTPWQPKTPWKPKSAL